jgi:hypothetical protein
MAKSKAKGANSPKRPTSVKIFFLTYRINYYTEPEWLASPLDNDLAGQCDSNASCMHIRISPSIHEQMLREVVLHEILHAIWWHMGLRDNPIQADDVEAHEEEHVLRTSHGLMPVMQENPKLMAWLMSPG